MGKKKQVRVLRIMEYTYPDAYKAITDRQAWHVQDGAITFGTGCSATVIRQSTMLVSEVFPPEAIPAPTPPEPLFHVIQYSRWEPGHFARHEDGTPRAATWLGCLRCGKVYGHNDLEGPCSTIAETDHIWVDRGDYRECILCLIRDLDERAERACEARMRATAGYR